MKDHRDKTTCAETSPNKRPPFLKLSFLKPFLTKDHHSLFEDHFCLIFRLVLKDKSKVRGDFWHDFR